MKIYKITEASEYLGRLESMSKTPRTDEIIKDFVSGNGEAASIMLLRQDVE
jgi:hypothetical protein